LWTAVAAVDSHAETDTTLTFHDTTSSIAGTGVSGVLSDLPAAAGRAARVAGVAKEKRMELKQAIGSRRSIRYFLPWRPVEREKIQTILEAARQSSRAVNASWAKAIVVTRDELDPEVREVLKTPTTTSQLDLAPTWIFWFSDLTSPEMGPKTLKKLVDVFALTTAMGWSHEYVDKVVYPQVLAPLKDIPQVLASVAGVETGQAIANALLAAVDEGLGTGLVSVNNAKAKDVLGYPDHFVPGPVQLVGYPAESPDAGGARPREPFDEMFFEGKYGSPFVPDQSVTEVHKKQGLIHTSAPAPWREAEVRGLARMFGLPE
jgi:nitroreductase